MEIVRPGTLLPTPWPTYGSDGASITATGLAVTDIEWFRVESDGSLTSRASDNGYTLLATDGIDIGGITGWNGFQTDLADNSIAGFWRAGFRYICAVATITVDGVTIMVEAANIFIGYGPASILDTTIASLSSQTSFTLTSGPTEDNALNGLIAVIVDVASGTQLSVVQIQDYTGSTKTVSLTTAPTFTIAATDNICVFMPAPLQNAACRLQTSDNYLETDGNFAAKSDVYSISGDANAADNLEAILDGTGGTVRLAAVGSDPALRISTDIVDVPAILLSASGLNASGDLAIGLAGTNIFQLLSFSGIAGNAAIYSMSLGYFDEDSGVGSITALNVSGTILDDPAQVSFNYNFGTIGASGGSYTGVGVEMDVQGPASFAGFDMAYIDDGAGWGRGARFEGIETGFGPITLDLSTGETSASGSIVANSRVNIPDLQVTDGDVALSTLTVVGTFAVGDVAISNGAQISGLVEFNNQINYHGNVDYNGTLSIFDLIVLNATFGDLDINGGDWTIANIGVSGTLGITNLGLGSLLVDDVTVTNNIDIGGIVGSATATMRFGGGDATTPTWYVTTTDGNAVRFESFGGVGGSSLARATGFSVAGTGTAVGGCGLASEGFGGEPGAESVGWFGAAASTIPGAGHSVAAFWTGQITFCNFGDDTRDAGMVASGGLGTGTHGVDFRAGAGGGGNAINADGAFQMDSMGVLDDVVVIGDAAIAGSLGVIGNVSMPNNLNEIDLGSGERTSIATAVWASATRTLTSFGTLVADIWSYVTRTLTSGAGLSVDLNADAVNASTLAPSAVQEIQAGFYGNYVTINTTDGTAGTTYPTGSQSMPSSNLADALSIATARTLRGFYVQVGTLTMVSSYLRWSWVGLSPTSSVLNFNAQTVTGCRFESMFIFNTAGVVASSVFVDCNLSTFDATGGGNTFYRCRMGGTTFSLPATITMMYGCSNGLSASAARFDFGAAIGDSTFSNMEWSGLIELWNMGQTGIDHATITGEGRLTINTTTQPCIGGSINLFGTWIVEGEFNVSGRPTITGDWASAIRRNVALANFTFVMYDTVGSPAAGLTVTATRRLDNGAFAACANAASSVASGVYTIDLAASDLNGGVVTLRFSATGARDTIITIVTQP